MAQAFGWTIKEIAQLTIPQIMAIQDGLERLNTDTGHKPRPADIPPPAEFSKGTVEWDEYEPSDMQQATLRLKEKTGRDTFTPSEVFAEIKNG